MADKPKKEEFLENLGSLADTPKKVFGEPCIVTDTHMKNSQLIAETHAWTPHSRSLVVRGELLQKVAVKKLNTKTKVGIVFGNQCEG